MCVGARCVDVSTGQAVNVCVCVCVHLSELVLCSVASAAADADPESGSWLLSKLWLQPPSPGGAASFTVVTGSEPVASMLS